MNLKDSTSSAELGQAPLAKLLLRFSIPAIFALLVNAFYNLVDRLYLSHYLPKVPAGSAATAEELANALMAGVGFAMPFMEFIAVFGVLIGSGSTALLSISLGAKDQEKAERIVGQCVALELLVFVFLPVIAYFLMEPVLRRFGAHGYPLDYACSYLSVILVGSLFMHLSYGLGGLIRAEGKATMAMVTMVVGAISNVILDPLLIFGKCGLPELGVEGAAWATNLAMLFSAAVGLAYLRSKKSPVRLHPRRIAIYRGIVPRVLAIGMMPAVMQVVGSFISICYIRGYELWGGEDAALLISAIVIIQGVHTVVLMPACGIAQAAQPIIGYSFGAGKYARMVKCTMKATRYATIMSTIFFIVVMAGAPVITRAFVSPPAEGAVEVEEAERGGERADVARPSATEAEPTKGTTAPSDHRRRLYEKTVWGMRVLALGFPLFAIPVMLSTYYQSIGRAKTALVVSLLRSLVVLLPLIHFLPYLFGGVNGVWYSQPVSDLISGVGCGCILFYERRKIRGMLLARRHRGHGPEGLP